MVTGSVTKMGGELEFSLSCMKMARSFCMKRFRIADDPLSLAGDVGGFIQEVVTGKVIEEEEEVSRRYSTNSRRCT